MSRELAHELLDRAKAGELISERAITEALFATGDLPNRWFDPDDETEA